MILKYLQLSLLDLAPIEEISAQIERRRTRQRVAEVAFIPGPIGPGRPWMAGVNWRKSFPLPFPAATVPAGLVMAKLAADPTMIPTLASYDIALLDTSRQSRSAISPQGLYAIEHGGEAVLRYMRASAHGYYLVTDDHLDQPVAWELIRLSGAQLGAAIKARVLWLGREDDREVSPQSGRFLDNPISS